MPSARHHDTFFRDPASYRDPSGFVFSKDNVVYRQVNKVYAEDYNFLLESGAYDAFVKEGWLIPHEEIKENFTNDDDWYTTIRPVQIQLITYPFEWSFAMLRDAALLTLRLAIRSLDYGLSLKDATPYNLQWVEGRLRFIDTLSFERYKPAHPWIAYRQFCECFLAPLALMHFSKTPLHQLQLAYPEGVPLDVARKLLPRRSRFRLGIYLHLHLHGKISAENKDTAKSGRTVFSQQKMINLLRNLESVVQSLRLPEQNSTWSGYYSEASMRADYLTIKKKIVSGLISNLPEVRTIADLGANEGEFSLIGASSGKQMIAADFDPFCIDRLYKKITAEGVANVQPLVLDLATPSPGIGVNNEEHGSFLKRCKVDAVLALALIHHLTITKNIPLITCAAMFAGLAPLLIIEFVPCEDEKAALLLRSKTAGYHPYSKEEFLSSFSAYYNVVTEQPIGDSGRIIYAMNRKPQV